MDSIPTRIHELKMIELERRTRRLERAIEVLSRYIDGRYNDPQNAEEVIFGILEIKPEQ